MTIVAREAAPCCAEEERRLSKLEQTLMRAFWQSLGDDPLPPMAALEAAARIVGTLYTQVARAHEGPNACRCGWEPDPDGDLIVLEANLAAALLASERGPDLARMPAAGRA